MCDGGPKAKYITRDSAARVKGVAFERDKSEEPARVRLAGLRVWFGALSGRMLRKDAMHV